MLLIHALKYKCDYLKFKANLHETIIYV
jgi:hypothetical protein